MLVEAGCEIARELYLGIVIDRAAGLPVLMASSAGGMNIEDVAAKTPELIFKETFCPDAGLQSYQVRKLAAKLDLTGASVRSAEKFMQALCQLFVDSIAAWSRSIRSSSPRPATSSRSTPRSASTTTPSSATRNSPSSATSPKKTRTSSAPARPASATCSSTATSAAS